MDLENSTQRITSRFIILAIVPLVISCALPAPEKKTRQLRTKHNYIILVDLSDRLIVQNDQAQRDKQIITELYSQFEEKVKKDLYIKSRDEIKVVIAPQSETGLD